MKLFRLKVILVAFLMVTSMKAQEFKTGRISVLELQEKKHPIDTSAPAAILYKKGRTFFTYDIKKGFVMNHEFTYRIKIYKKGGLSWANFEVPYYIGYENLSDEMLSFSDAVTYNLENGDVIKTKLNSEGVFKTKINDDWKMAKLSMPNVKAGSVIEFSYLLKSENLVRFPVCDFQYTIPVNYAEYKTEIPEYYIYKTILKGYVDVKSDSKVNQGSVSFANEYGQTRLMTYKQISSSYIAKDVPALKEEEFVDNIRNYQCSLHNELERTRFPEQPVKDYSVTWEGVAKTIFENKNFGNQLAEINYLVNDVKLLLKSEDSKDERLKKIFKFVQEKMNWNQEYGYYADKGVVKAYEERTGNAAEINFILISMLRLAGVEANPVLISTINHGIPVFPGRTVFNYVVAMVDIDGKLILLDATHKYTTQNILPLNALNWTGRLIKADGTSQEVNLLPSVPSVVNCNVMAKIDASGKITGDLRSRKTNYEAYSYREKFAQTNTDNYVERIENSYNGVEISNYEVKNKNEDLLEPVDESFTFQSVNHTEIIGKEFFINPMLFFTMNKNPFLQENRKMPVYFGYPTQKKYMINLEIPEGFEVESIPNGINLSAGDGALTFKCFLVKNDNRIQIAVQTEFKKTMVSAEDYSMLKDFYQKIVDKEKEKIVLKKI